MLSNQTQSDIKHVLTSCSVRDGSLFMTAVVKHYSLTPAQSLDRRFSWRREADRHDAVPTVGTK